MMVPSERIELPISSLQVRRITTLLKGRISYLCLYYILAYTIGQSLLYILWLNKMFVCLYPIGGNEVLSIDKHHLTGAYLALKIGLNDIFLMCIPLPGPRLGPQV